MLSEPSQIHHSMVFGVLFTFFKQTRKERTTFTLCKSLQFTKPLAFLKVQFTTHKSMRGVLLFTSSAIYSEEQLLFSANLCESTQAVKLLLSNQVLRRYHVNLSPSGYGMFLSNPSNENRGLGKVSVTRSPESNAAMLELQSCISLTSVQ